MVRAKVIQNGEQQTIVLPSSIHLDGDEVLIQKMSPKGILKIVPVRQKRKPDWDSIFQALDQAGVPDDFMADRDMSPADERPDW